jgi:hypothetical protein
LEVSFEDFRGEADLLICEEVELVVRSLVLGETLVAWVDGQKNLDSLLPSQRQLGWDHHVFDFRLGRFGFKGILIVVADGCLRKMIVV